MLWAAGTCTARGRLKSSYGPLRMLHRGRNATTATAPRLIFLKGRAASLGAAQGYDLTDGPQARRSTLPVRLADEDGIRRQQPFADLRAYCAVLWRLWNCTRPLARPVRRNAL